MGHGKHCDCVMCAIGKAIGMIPKCTDDNCTHESHQKDKEETKSNDGKENEQQLLLINKKMIIFSKNE